MVDAAFFNLPGEAALGDAACSSMLVAVLVYPDSCEKVESLRSRPRPLSLSDSERILIALVLASLSAVESSLKPMKLLSL